MLPTGVNHEDSSFGAPHDTQTVVKGATTVGSFNLDYDAASNVTSRAETVKTETGANNADSGTWTYAYDAAGRMTSSTISSTTTTYAYDGAGNRTSVKVGTGNPVTTTYDAAGLPTSSSDNTTYTHDAVGELTKIDRSGGTANDWNLVYDSWGNTKSASHKSTGTPDVTYALDALDRVLSRTSGSSTTTYTYRGTGEEAAKTQVGTGTATPVYYAYTPGGPLAQRTGTDGTTLRYYLRDLHGDVVGVAATTGTNPVKGSILFSPGGVPGTKTGESSTFPAQGYPGFQGDLTDSLTGQVDMLTRYYEPALGRFDTRDVLFGDLTDPASLNQFVYAQDSPITYNDPTGMLIPINGGGPCDRKCEADAEEVAQIAAEGGDPYADHPSPGTSSPPRVISPEAQYTLRQFESMNEQERRVWLDRFVTAHELGPWFEGIKGVLMAGAAINGQRPEEGFLDPGSWSSVVDAVILNRIQDGFFLSEGAVRHASAGAQLWADFFTSRTDERFSTAARLSAWATAETAATHRGAQLARAQGLSPNPGEQAVYAIGEMFRAVVLSGNDPKAAYENPVGIFAVSAYNADPRSFDPRLPWQAAQQYVIGAWVSGMRNGEPL